MLAKEQAGVVGPLLKVEVGIAGVPLTALLDTGTQSTIISRETLLSVVGHLRRGGEQVLEQELPSARLFSKDGEKVASNSI